MRMVLPAGLLALGVMGTALAAEPAKAPPVEVPSPEMLEFLGNWMTDDGEWVDPLAMEELEIEGADITDGEPSPRKTSRSTGQKMDEDDEDRHEVR